MSYKKVLKIVSFNCNSVRNKVDIVRTLIDNYDIVCLQETFLSKLDVNFIYGLRNNINFHISDCVYNSNFNSGRPKGGLLTIWKTSIDKFLIPLISNDNYQAIKIKSADGDILIFNTYMPYDDNSIDQLIRYREVLASLSHEIESNPGCKINIIGDLNSDPNRPRLWREITSFCQEFYLTVADGSLPSESFTYLSPMHDTTSWLDHILSSVPENISNILILHYLSLYDHFPISFDLHVDLDISLSTQFGVEPDLFVNWKKFNSGKQEFFDKLDSNFSIDSLNNDAFRCDKIICDNPRHKQHIEESYGYLLDGFLSASDHLTHGKTHSYKQVPGWNDFCKDYHRVALKCLLNWKEEGMPRNGICYERMKKSRTDFRSALKHCQENEQRLRNEKLVSSFQNKDFRSFWRNISAKQKSKISNMDGNNDCQGIADLFGEKYFHILDDKDCQSKSVSFEKDILNVKTSVKGPFKISQQSIRDNVICLKTAIGYDNIHSNHLKYATDSCIRFIALLFNAMIQHVYFPSEFLRGEIRPVLKNKSGKINDSENYRPVMISSNILKLFEKCIQPFLNNGLRIHRNQFGFRANTSTNMTVTVVKEVLYRYKNNGSKVYAGFIDLSKAFDKVNHYKLIDRLMDLPDLSPNLKLITKEFLLNQSAYVKFNNCVSNTHHIGNGCRQGGINSPLLFNFYINEMIRDINT